MWRQQITMQTKNVAFKYVTRTFKGLHRCLHKLYYVGRLMHIHLWILLKSYQNNAFLFKNVFFTFDNLKQKSSKCDKSWLLCKNYSYKEIDIQILLSISMFFKEKKKKRKKSNIRFHQCASLHLVHDKRGSK